MIEHGGVRARLRRWWGALAIAAGTAAAARGEAEPSPVHARSRTSWIYPAPRVSPQPLGYVRAGHALARRDADVRRGAGCAAGWVAVQPQGFMCLDSASLEQPRYVRALHDTLSGAGPLDFEFALSTGTPAYRRVPTAAEWALRELAFAPVRRFALPPDGAAHLALAGAALSPDNGALPWFLRTNGSALHDTERELVREVVPAGSTLAYTGSFEAEGRRWLLGTDGSIVPADRVQRFRRTSFRGVELGAKLQLPLFWLRGHGADKYELGRDGAPHIVGRWGRLTAVALDPAHGSATRSRRRYLKTGEAGANGAPLYVLESEATVVAERVALPAEIGPTSKWLRFSISKGTLVAYEGRRAVFTTLASPGLGAVAGDGGASPNATPLGTFRISVKHLSDDMGPEVRVEGQPRMAEVPYAQYFDMPFAIHVAYWHDRFGEPMSGGCINVSPLDGAFLFDWTSPQLPPGWDAVLAGGAHGLGTIVRVVR